MGNEEGIINNDKDNEPIIAYWNIKCQYCGEYHPKYGMIAHQKECKKLMEQNASKVACRYCDVLWFVGIGIARHEKLCKENPNRIPGWERCEPSRKKPKFGMRKEDSSSTATIQMTADNAPGGSGGGGDSKLKSTSSQSRSVILKIDDMKNKEALNDPKDDEDDDKDKDKDNNNNDDTMPSSNTTIPKIAP